MQLANNHSLVPKEDFFAKIISYLLHPLLMPTYGILLVLNLETYIALITPPVVKKAVYVITFVSTFLFPAVSVLILLKFKSISDLEIRARADRKLPYIITAVSYTAGYYLIVSLIPVSKVLNLLLLGANAGVIIGLIINYWWKISAHMIGIGGVLGIVVGLAFRLSADLRNVIALIAVLAGLVGYARLKLKAHSPEEVYAGFIVGFFLEFILLILV